MLPPAPTTPPAMPAAPGAGPGVPAGWCLQLARAPRLQRGHDELVLPWLDAALLAWLVLEGPTPRARLATLLWPGSDAEAARNSLRQRLFKLRRWCGAELAAGPVVLALAAGLSHDLDEADDLLGDDMPALGPEFDAWLAQQRSRRRERRRSVLLAACAQAEAAAEWPAALAHAHALLQLTPLHEEAHRRLMRLHYLAGDRSAALLAFDHCERVLKHEIGTRPAAETLALLQTIEAAAASRAVPVGPVVPASVQRPPRLVGRDAEYQLLREAWAEGRCVLVSGEAGLGKSRLLGDFAASMGGGSVLVSGARPGDDRVAYASLSRLLRRLPPARLQALPVALRQPLARLLPELGEAAPLRGEGDRSRFFNAVLALVDEPGLALAGCVVDDLHWADAASLELLQYLVAGSRCRWLLAARQAELPAAARAWLDELLATPEAQPVVLQPLGRAQVVELVDSLAVPGLVAAAHADALLRHTGGNPLYLLETVKAWLAHGGQAPAVAAVPSRPTRPSLPALPVASNVNTLIARRIGQLSPAAVQLARCAALAAPDFSIALASQVLGLRTLELADPWAELEAAQVLRDDGAFAHDLILEAARASVPEPVARQLHAEIAAFLAAGGAEPATLALHWARAGRWREAGAAWLAAAGRACDAGRAVEQAERLAEAARCLAQAGAGEARFDALLQRAEVLASNDLGADAQQAVAELEQVAGSELQRLQALGARLELAVTRFEIDAALQLAPQAVQAAHALGRHDLELRFAICWSGALGDARRMDDGVRVLEPYLAWVDTQASAQQRWEYWEARALALDYAGRLRDSIAGWQTCQALARAAGRNDLLWRSFSNAAAGLAKTGRVQAAVALSTQARQLALDGGEVGRLRLLQMQAPHAHRLRDCGRYAEAMPLLEEALQGFLAEGSPTDITMTVQRLALLCLHLGQPARAAQHLALARPGVPPGVAMYQKVLEAELALATGADAVAPIRAALASLPNPDDVFHRIATLSAARIVPADEGEALAIDLAHWARERERLGLALAAHVRAAACMAAQQAWSRALPQVQAALALAEGHQPESFYVAELWLVAAQVFHAAGETRSAARASADGQAWVQARHDHDVPAPFRESFLHRNPTNRALRALPLR